MNTITQIYGEHASMPPRDGEKKKRGEEKNRENLINYLLHDGEYCFCFILPRVAPRLRFPPLVNSSPHRHPRRRRRCALLFSKNCREQSRVFLFVACSPNLYLLTD